MTDKKAKRRGWVKNAAIIFLAVMLALTYFSDQILARSLPQVAAIYASSGTITAKIRGQGVVTANETYEVIVNQTRTVKSVLVRTGDKVERGDTLFVLDENESTELDEAQKALKELETSYQKALINASDTDYAKSNRDIQYARDDYNAAVQALSELTAVPAAELLAARRAEETERANVLARQNEVLTIEAEIALLQANDPYLIELASKISGKNTEIGTVAAELDAANQADGVEDTDSDAYKLVRELEDKLAALNAELSVLQDEYDNYSSGGELAIKLQSAQAALSAAESKHAIAQNILSSLEERQGNYDTAAELVKQTEKNLADLLFALSEQQKADNKTSAAAALDLAALRESIEDQKERIIALQEDAVGATIEADVSGIVKAVYVTAGGATQHGQAIALIEVSDRGYSLSFSVTNEQAKRLKTGDKAETSGYYYWGPEISATLSQIKNDTESAGARKLLVFDIVGEIESGSQLTLSIGERSADYDIVVPNSAIRSDNNGEFVLLVVAKNTALKSRYIAQRVDVTVVATDDTNSAISGGGLSGWGDYIITTSNKPLEPGMQVAIVD